jgi:AraC-like DNA-binding protein
MNRQNNSFSDISFTSSSMITIFETRFERWNAVDLDFFDSAYEEKIIATAKSVQHVEKDTYFRDVHLFIDRIKNIVIVKDYDIVRNNLYTCFREQVMIWYISEMTDEEKELIKIESNLNVWERYLIKRFRERSNVAMITIIKERYIMKDARRRRESREYVDVIMRIARSAELESESH